MNDQMTTQLKVLSVQVSNGDLEKAQSIFEWLTNDYVDQEVQRRLDQRARTEAATNVVTLA